MPGFDQNRIAHLEEQLVESPGGPEHSAASELEMLADLYLQADRYVPALETIQRLLELPEARALSSDRRAALESKSISCRLARGDCQGALAHCRELLQKEPDMEPALRSRVRLQCSESLFRLGRLDQCLEYAETGLTIADEIGDLWLSAQALNLIGRWAFREGDLRRARDAYEQALVFYRRLGDEVTSAHVRNNLGLVHKNLCEWELAIAHLQAALDLHRKGGRFAETANPLMNLGIVYQKSGSWKEASDCYTEARQVYLQIGDDFRLTVVDIGLGNIARLERRFEQAERLLSDALERARVHGAQREEVLALEFLGELQFDRGRPEKALALYHEALPAAERLAPEGDLIVELERRRAEALAAIGRKGEAEAALRRSRKLAERIEDKLELAISYRVEGGLALSRGARDEAIQIWEQAARRLAACRERFELGRTLLELGRALGKPVDARRALYRASTLFAELTTPYWQDITEGELESLGFEPPAAPRPQARHQRAPRMLACSYAMRRVETLAKRAAGTELSVLITGATGTGKELVARTIHALSSRSDRPYLAVNCGVLRAELALSQLFGHRKGAFTGAHAEGPGLVEAANGGTLFLDEVGELPQDVQVTLLRFLESGEYFRIGDTQVRRADVRVIAATNCELHSAEGEKQFRRDLLFRLNEIEIHVPALRERADDIVALARHFLAFYGSVDGPKLTADAESVLTSYEWPGNVRELENVTKRLAALHSGDAVVDAYALIPFLSLGREGTADGRVNGRGSASLEADERAAILAAYAEARGNKSRVAEMLGVSRKTLYARIKRLRLELP